MHRVIKFGAIASLTFAASLAVPAPVFADSGCDIDPQKLCGVICIEICVLGICSPTYQEINGKRRDE